MRVCASTFFFMTSDWLKIPCFCPFGPRMAGTIRGSTSLRLLGRKGGYVPLSRRNMGQPEWGYVFLTRCILVRVQALAPIRGYVTTWGADRKGTCPILGSIRGHVLGDTLPFSWRIWSMQQPTRAKCIKAALTVGRLLEMLAALLVA